MQQGYIYTWNMKHVHIIAVNDVNEQRTADNEMKINYFLNRSSRLFILTMDTMSVKKR